MNDAAKENNIVGRTFIFILVSFQKPNNFFQLRFEIMDKFTSRYLQILHGNRYPAI